MMSTYRLRMLALVAAAALAGALLALVAQTKPAEAAFPGENGRIALAIGEGTIGDGITGRDTDIYTSGPDNGLIQLTDDELNEWAPSYSPDGNKVTYMGTTRRPTGTVVVDVFVVSVAADGTPEGSPISLTNDDYDSFTTGYPVGSPTFSPEGDQIAYVGAGRPSPDFPNSYPYEIFTIPLTPEGSPAGAPTQLTNLNGTNIDGRHVFGIRGAPIRYSPDGSRIVLVGDTRDPDPECSSDCGSNDYYTISAGGGGPTRITNQPINIESGADFSPDGTQLTYAASDGDSREVFTIPSGGGTPTQVTDNTPGPVHPVFSPDGTKITYAAVDVSGGAEYYTVPVNAFAPATASFTTAATGGTPILVASGGPSVMFATTMLAQVGHGPAPGLRITDLALMDIDDTPLRFLSTDDHDYFDADGVPDATNDGNTRIHGTITVQGSPTDELESLELEVSRGGDVATAPLSATAEAALLRPFPPGGELSIGAPELLFELPSAEADRFDSDVNGNVALRVRATSRDGHDAERASPAVPRLVRYTGANRYPDYPDRDAARGGDDWVLPSVRPAIPVLSAINPGTVWGDFSNMNGGSFRPTHTSHQEGDIGDGDAPWYDARNAATADNFLEMLRHPVYGPRISRVLVTFNRPGTPRRLRMDCENNRRDTDHGEFYRQIRGERVPAPGGGTRLATDVIRPLERHCVHFHMRFYH